MAQSTHLGGLLDVEGFRVFEELVGLHDYFVDVGVLISGFGVEVTAGDAERFHHIATSWGGKGKQGIGALDGEGYIRKCTF